MRGSPEFLSSQQSLASQAYAAIGRYRNGEVRYMEALIVAVLAHEADPSSREALAEALGPVVVGATLLDRLHAKTIVAASTPAQAVRVEAQVASGVPGTIPWDVYLVKDGLQRYQAGSAIYPLLEEMLPCPMPGRPVPRLSLPAPGEIDDDGGGPLQPTRPETYRHVPGGSVDAVEEEIDGVLRNVYYIDGQPFFLPPTR